MTVFRNQVQFSNLECCGEHYWSLNSIFLLLHILYYNLIFLLFLSVQKEVCGLLKNQVAKTLQQNHLYIGQSSLYCIDKWWLLCIFGNPKASSDEPPQKGHTDPILLEGEKFAEHSRQFMKIKQMIYSIQRHKNPTAEKWFINHTNEGHCVY